MFSSGTSRKSRSRYRSSRSVRRQREQPPPDNWTRCKICLILGGVLLMVFMALSPMIALQKLEQDLRGEVVGLSALLHHSKSLQYPPQESEASAENHKKEIDSEEEAQLKRAADKEKKKHGPPVFERNDVIHQKKTAKKKLPKKDAPKQEVEAPKPNDQYRPTPEELKLARGVSGLPFEKTPALIGAKRGHIQCNVDVNDLAYWNNPQGTRDQEFVTHFQNPTDRYLTFEPDPGGWNNIRMSMEVIFVLAAATGRTLVLPPRAPMYLLGDGTQNARSFANFFPLDDELRKKVNVITMEEFLVQQGGRLLGLNESAIEELRPVADICVHQPPEKDKRSCEVLFPILREKGFQPQMEAEHHCLVFDNDVFDNGGNLTADKQERVNKFCGVRNCVRGGCRARVSL